MTNIIASVIIAVVTNWDPNPPFPNLVYCSGGESSTVHYEQATISSNKVLKVEWGGEIKEFVLDSSPFMLTNRSYSLEKVYKGEDSCPISIIRFLHGGTQQIFPTNNLIIYQQTNK